jgi:phage pi2 protein 07
MEQAVTRETAWMIRNDGVEIPIITHIYADKDETDELLALAYFLWNDYDSKQTVCEFLATWVSNALLSRRKPETFTQHEIANAIKDYLSSKPYRIFPERFATIIAHYNSTFYPIYYGKFLTLPLDGTDLVDTLNQRFLRARYGGRYDTTPGCHDMFFRISSVGFDWFPIICNFVKNYVDPIETVTIVRDFESTACEKYYVDSNNRQYNKMPYSDFLNGSGNTNYLGKSEADSSFNVREALANGGGVQQLRCLPMNYGRIRRMIEILKHKEETHLADE